MNRETALHWFGDLEAELEGVKAELAEAVGILQSIRQDLTDSGSISQVDAFLAIHAKAEQHGAREETLDDILGSPCAPCEEETQSHPTAHQLGYCGGLGTCNECTPKEPQGGQAWDDLPRSLRSVIGMVLNALDRDAADGKLARGEMATELRAALATQPAAVEPIDDYDATVNDIICMLKGTDDEMAFARRLAHAGYRRPYLFAPPAPPAAAHEDKAK